MKNTLLKISIILISITFLSGCIDGSFKEMYAQFNDAITKRDTYKIKQYTTDHGMERIAYNFGDLTNSKNKNALFHEIHNVFSDPIFEKKSDSVIYVSSERVTAFTSGTYMTFIKREGQWFLDDYRRGK